MKQSSEAWFSTIYVIVIVLLCIVSSSALVDDMCDLGSPTLVRNSMPDTLRLVIIIVVQSHVPSQLIDVIDTSTGSCIIKAVSKN